MVDNPLAWANGEAYTAEEVALYAYDRTLVNDVHMSHALEFPYPQSMANCKTCHEGNLTAVLDDSNFTLATCKSCHVIRGLDSWPDDGTGSAELYNQPHRPPAFSYLWQRGADLTFHLGLTPVDPDTDCTAACHGAIAPSFADYHTGYDPMIYDDAGNKYADTYTVSIDTVSYDDVNDTITVEYSASDAAIVPELLVSFYGWDSKDFIVPSHWRDVSTACNGRGCRFEFEPGDVNPLFTADNTVVAPSYRTTANLSAFVAELTDDIPTLIDNMDVTKFEVTLTPYIDLGLADDVTLESVTATYDLTAGMLVNDFYKGDGAIVDYQKCNACHDQLAVTFHSGSGRAGEMTMCRNCHASTNGGSHLEMQSRSIESYVHAIHSFQDFDVDDTFDTSTVPFDPVFAKRYDMHIEHVFPYFTRLACEGCHVEAGAETAPGSGVFYTNTYNVPDQSKSMPGLMSDSWQLDTWYDIVAGANPDVDAALERAAGRDIGTVPEYVVGPASKACGGCHRAELINKDLPGDLAAFNAHTAAFGTLVENDANDEVVFGIIDKILTLFE
jgi:OmcA/MtrC family decaheme c-type cytochrome